MKTKEKGGNMKVKAQENIKFQVNKDDARIAHMLLSTKVSL